MPTMDLVKPVVVAVDGSPESLEALRWAVVYARSIGARVRVVTAVAPVAPPTSDSSGGYWEDGSVAQSRTRQRVGAAMAPVLAELDASVDHVVALGPIDRVLATHTRDALVTVVGTRSNRGWRRLLRRSTTNRITGMLTTPVVSIAPGDAERRTWREFVPA